MATYTTLSYKRLPNDKEVLLDFYPPETSGSAAPIPAIVFFHAGSLMMGNRRVFFPAWLQKRANSLGYAFISADYQLLLPSTGHHIVNDIQDVFKFIVENDFAHRKTTFEIDSEQIVVAGGSSGGCLAHLAAAHISSPKLKGVLSLYTMGGDFLTSHWIQPKTKPFFMGRPLGDPVDSNIHFRKDFRHQPAMRLLPLILPRDFPPNLESHLPHYLYSLVFGLITTRENLTRV